MMALVRALGVEFAKRDGQKFVTLSNGVLELLDKELVTLENLIYQKAVDIADANTPTTMTVAKIKKLLKERVGPDGTLQDMLAKASTNIYSRVANEMSRLNGEGYATDEIRRAIIGTAANSYSDGIMANAVRGSEVMMRTSAVLADEIAADAERRSNNRVIGYVWVSVLDGGTTITCADLNGREYYYEDSGPKPLPPQHVGCRSSTEAIKDDGKVPKVVSIYDFIKKDPTAAREMLGDTRYQLVTKGKLKIDRFTDQHFSPLTIDELRAKNAVAFGRIE